MKRRQLIQHLRSHGCELLREGSTRHSWCHNPTLNKRSAVTWHTEISDSLIRKICKDLGIPQVQWTRTWRGQRGCFNLSGPAEGKR
jgi:mRNA interferase HicA